jgi:hypothetical protein
MQCSLYCVRVDASVSVFALRSTIFSSCSASNDLNKNQLRVTFMEAFEEMCKYLIGFVEEAAKKSAAAAAADPDKEMMSEMLLAAILTAWDMHATLFSHMYIMFESLDRELYADPSQPTIKIKTRAHAAFKTEVFDKVADVCYADAPRRCAFCMADRSRSVGRHASCCAAVAVCSACVRVC